MYFGFSKKVACQCIALIACTVLLSGCVLGWLGVPSPAPMLERRQAQKSTSDARAGGVRQAEMRLNNYTLLVRIKHLFTHYDRDRNTNGKAFWRFWRLDSYNKQVAENLLANEGILLDAKVQLERDNRLEQDIEIPCFSTENIADGLSLAYLDDQGTIISLMDTLPDVRLPLYCAPKEVKRALLMPYGWFEAHNVKVGDAVSDLTYINNKRRDEIIAQWPAPPARQLALAEIEKAYIPALHNGVDRVMETKIVGPWIGQASEKEAQLVIIVPSEPANQQASIERYKSLKPWESVLYYINEQHYYTEESGTYKVAHPGSGRKSVATLDRNGTIIRMFDVNETDEIILHDKYLERYALIVPYGWLEAYAHPSSKILPFNPLSRSQLPQAIIRAQAQQAQTERLMALVRLKKQQDAEFLAWSRDFNRLQNYYDIQVTHRYGSPKIGGSHDELPGFLDRLFGNDGSNLRSRAWQCSDRSYTVTLRPKQNIAYVDAARNAYPVTIDATWQMNHVIGGSAATGGSVSRQLKLPIQRTNQVSESFTFNCVDDLHTEQGQETESELRMALAGQPSSFRVHHATPPSRHINSRAVYAENSRQWGLLEAKIDAHNASVAARNARQAGGTGNHPGYVSIHVEMTCGIIGCVTKNTSATAISGSFNIESHSSHVTIFGLPTATGRVRVISSFNNDKTCAAEVSIADGNDYDLNFTTSCDIGYFNAR